MAELDHVQPGDLITSQLINDIIDTLRALDAKIDKCCEEVKQPPKEKEKVFIDSITPFEAGPEEVVTIIGGGFVPDGQGNSVVIGDTQVKVFGRISPSVIEAAVPPFRFKNTTPVPVIVKNANGIAEGKMQIRGEAIPGVPFVPTPIEVVEAMLKIAKVSKADRVYDLGSGDGRVVIRAAQDPFFASGVGIDIDPQRIKEANALAKKAGVSDRVKFVEGDLLRADVSDATVIAIHLLPAVNLQLRPTLEKLAPGTRIVSHQFDMGDWKPDSHTPVKGTDRVHDVYLWIVPKR